MYSASLDWIMPKMFNNPAVVMPLHVGMQKLLLAAQLVARSAIEYSEKGPES